MNVIRLNVTWPDLIVKEIEAARRMKGVMDEGWLGLWGYYSEEEHDALEKNYARAAECLRKHDVRVVFEMGANLGHSCSEGESPVTASFRNMVDIFGKSYHGAYCPRCENLRAYQHRVISRYAKYHPYAVIIDDDARMELHGGFWLGCFCDECIKLFNQRYGYRYSRDEIRKRFLTDGDFRRQYMAFDRDSLADYVGFMASEVMAVSPDSHMGYENVYLGGYHGGNHNHVWEALYRVSGKDVIARSGNGNYTDDRPRDTLHKMMQIHYQTSQLPPYVSYRRCEIDNCEFNFSGKSVRGTMMEAEINLALGCNGTTFSVIGECGEPLSYGMRYLKALETERPYFEALRAWSQNSTVQGLHPVLYEDAYATRTLTQEEEQEVESGKRNTQFWAKVPFDAGWAAWTVGLPLSYEDNRAYLLHPAMVSYLSDGQIEELLSKNVLTDGECLSALAARGFGNDFPAQANPCDLPREETYGDSPEHGRINFIGDASACHALTPVGNAAEEGRFTPVAHAGGKVASALLKTTHGGLWCVCANHLFRFTVNSARRAFLLDMADTLSGGVGARLLSAEQAVVVPRKDDAGQCTGVFVHSITISDSDELTFEILKPASETFIWVTADNEPTACRYEKKNGRYYVHTPALRGYRSGLLLCGRDKNAE